MERTVRLPPNGERGLGADRTLGRRIGRLEPVCAGGEAFRPANRADAVGGAREMRSKSGEPGVGDKRIVLEAVQLQRAQDIEAELTQYRFEAAIHLGFYDPLEPGRNANIRGQSFDEISLAERGWPIGRDHAKNAIGMPGSKAHADGAAEIMHNQGDVAQIKGEDEAFQIVDVILQPVATVLRRRTLAEPHMIRDDHAVCATQRRDQMPKQIAPSRLAVKAKHNVAVARSLVDIVHLETRGIGEMRREREAAVEGIVGSDHGRWPLLELCVTKISPVGDNWPNHAIMVSN